MEDVKIKLAVFWSFIIVAMLITMTLSFFAPGTIDEIRAGEIEETQITGEYLLGSAIFLLVPLVMAVLSVTVKDKINRWANIILGIVYTILSIVGLVEIFSMDLSIFAFGLLMEVSVLVATVLIVWYAWKWPKQEG